MILSDKKPLEKKVRIQEIEKLQSDNKLTLMEEMLAEILEILKAFKVSFLHRHRGCVNDD